MPGIHSTGCYPCSSKIEGAWQYIDSNEHDILITSPTAVRDDARIHGCLLLLKDPPSRAVLFI